MGGLEISVRQRSVRCSLQWEDRERYVREKQGWCQLKISRGGQSCYQFKFSFVYDVRM